MREAMERQITAAAEEILHQKGLVLFGLKMHFGKSGLFLELLVDHPRGGITIDECADVNRRLVAHIDGDQIIEGNYSLAVSSPGLDWPLVTQKDFVRAIGQNIRVFLNEEVDQKKELAGTLQQVEEDRILLQVSSTHAVVVFLANIHKGVPII